MLSIKRVAKFIPFVTEGGFVFELLTSIKISSSYTFAYAYTMLYPIGYQPYSLTDWKRYAPKKSFAFLSEDRLNLEKSMSTFLE